jgi:peptidoglycan hydrolase CwlO-like protein
MTREEKLVILTELVKEDAITLEEAFGLVEDCEIEIGEFDDEDEEEDEPEEKVISLLDLINRIQSKMREVDEKIKTSETKIEKAMSFTEWLKERQKESKK